MNPNKRMKILRSERGVNLRNFFNAALADSADLPGKKQLAEMAEELFPGDENAGVRKELTEQFTKFARTAQDRGTRFELRGHVAALTVALVQRLDADDRILPVEEEPTDAEIQAIADKVGDPHGQKAGVAADLEGTLDMNRGGK